MKRLVCNICSSKITAQYAWSCKCGEFLGDDHVGMGFTMQKNISTHLDRLTRMEQSLERLEDMLLRISIPLAQK